MVRLVPLRIESFWMELDSLVERHKTTFKKVKGHADNPLNNRADGIGQYGHGRLFKSKKKRAEFL